MNQTITADVIAELVNSAAAEPILIRFLDDGSLDVIPTPYLACAEAVTESEMEIADREVGNAG